MNIVYLIHFLGDHLLLLVLAMNALGVGVLVKSMFTQDQQMKQQKQVIAHLRGHIADCLKAQITSFDQVDSLQERCARLLARQQLVEKRGPEAQRIELANRMLKRGAVDRQTLHDLGLTDSEIKLLTRLRAVPEMRSARAETPDKTSVSDAEGNDAVSEAETLKFEQPTLPKATQGQALARMFEARVATK